MSSSSDVQQIEELGSQVPNGVAPPNIPSATNANVNEVPLHGELTERTIDELLIQPGIMRRANSFDLKFCPQKSVIMVVYDDSLPICAIRATQLPQLQVVLRRILQEKGIQIGLFCVNIGSDCPNVFDLARIESLAKLVTLCYPGVFYLPTEANEFSQNSDCMFTGSDQFSRLAEMLLEKYFPEPSEDGSVDGIFNDGSGEPDSRNVVQSFTEPAQVVEGSRKRALSTVSGNEVPLDNGKSPKKAKLDLIPPVFASPAPIEKKLFPRALPFKSYTI